MARKLWKSRQVFKKKDKFLQGFLFLEDIFINLWNENKRIN